MPQRGRHANEKAAGGTVLLRDIYPGPGDSGAGELTNLDGTLLFTAAATDCGDALWRSDGTPDGTVLKPEPDSPFTRLLLHPHVNEQPFTRSQSGIVIPSGVTQVRVRAHDLVDGYGGREVLVDLTVPSGSDFEVIRPTPAP